MRGPYCLSLTANGFALKSIHGKIPADSKARFEQSSKQTLFEKFKEMVADKSVDQLEIMASLHYQSSIGTDVQKIKETVEKKQDRFTAADVDVMWSELEGYKLV